MNDKFPTAWSKARTEKATALIEAVRLHARPDDGVERSADDLTDDEIAAHNAKVLVIELESKYSDEGNDQWGIRCFAVGLAPVLDSRLDEEVWFHFTDANEFADDVHAGCVNGELHVRPVLR